MLRFLNSYIETSHTHTRANMIKQVKWFLRLLFRSVVHCPTYMFPISFSNHFVFFLFFVSPYVNSVAMNVIPDLLHPFDFATNRVWNWEPWTDPILRISHNTTGLILWFVRFCVLESSGNTYKGIHSEHLHYLHTPSLYTSYRFTLLITFYTSSFACLYNNWQTCIKNTIYVANSNSSGFCAFFFFDF